MRVCSRLDVLSTLRTGRSSRNRWALRSINYGSKGIVKIINKTKILLLLLVPLLKSCNSFTSSPVISQTETVETAISNIETAIVETQTAMPTTTFIAVPLPSSSPLPPTETSRPMPQSSPNPVSGTTTIIAMENGITWVECVAPIEDYPHSVEDQEFASRCLNMEIPVWDDNDRKMAGEWTAIATVTSNNNAVYQQVVGNDVYLIKQEGTNGCCDYEFQKNGKVNHSQRVRY